MEHGSSNANTSNVPADLRNVALPNNEHAEIAVLGAIIGDNKVFSEIDDELVEADFHTEPHRQIFAACNRLISEGRIASVVTLAANFKGTKWGDLCVVGIVESLQPVGVTAVEELNSYVRELKICAARRAQVLAARELEKDALFGNALPDETGRRAMERLDTIASRIGQRSSGDYDVTPWPEMSVAAFHGIAGDIARAATANSEADPVAVLVTTLTATGTMLDRNAFVNVGDTRHHSLLFSALVGESSRARKGTSEAPVSKIIEAADDVMSICDFTHQKLKITPGPLSSGEGLIYAIRDGKSEDDADADSAEDKGVNDKRLLVTDSELGAALRSMRRDGNTLSALMRRFWDGSNVEPLTKHNRLKASKPHVGVVAHITSHELKSLLALSDCWNGFGNRFLWIAVRRTKLVALPIPMPTDVVAALSQRLAAAVATAKQSREVRLSDEASALWQARYPTLTADRPGLAGVMTARSEAYALRLALTYALLDTSTTIETVHLEAAFAVVEYAALSARMIFGDVEVDPLVARILELLAKAPLTQTELRRALSNHVDTKQLTETLTHLQGVGRITATRVRGKGRPSTVFRLTGSA